MTPADLRATAAALGLKGRGLARALGVNERTYRRWLDGSTPIPQTVALACEALIARQASSLPQVQPVVSL
jgi:plasmid maintenance system antidote protein VapI